MKINLKEQIKLEKLLLTADIPNEIVKPYVEEMISSHGLTYLTENMNYSESHIHRTARGQVDKNTLEFCDELCMLNDYLSLDDLYDEAKEWAENNPEANWPLAYKPRKKPNKNGKKNGKTKLHNK